jgi:hypothetical protein
MIIALIMRSTDQSLLKLTHSLSLSLSLSSPSYDDTVRRQLSVSQEEGPHQELIYWHLDLGLPAFRTVRNKCC